MPKIVEPQVDYACLLKHIRPGSLRTANPSANLVSKDKREWPEGFTSWICSTHLKH